MSLLHLRIQPKFMKCFDFRKNSYNVALMYQLLQWNKWTIWSICKKCPFPRCEERGVLVADMKLQVNLWALELYAYILVNVKIIKAIEQEVA